MYVLNVTDFDNITSNYYTDFDNIKSTNCTYNENNFDIVIHLFTIIMRNVFNMFNINLWRIL